MEKIFFVARSEDTVQDDEELFASRMKLTTKINIDNSTEDPVKSPRNIAHLVRLQGFALVSYRLRAPHGWQGNKSFRV